MAKEPSLGGPLFEVFFIDPGPLFEPPHISATRVPRKRRNPPLKLQMLLHFYSIIGPFVPEATRTSPAYTQFVQELLRDGLIQRPTKAEREANPGWAYQTTDKGDYLVNALCTVQNPVEKIRFVIPS